MTSELNRCETLTRVCEAAAWSVDPQSVYENIADSGVEIFDCDGTHLHLLTVDGSRFVCHASHSSTQFIDKWKGVLPASVGRLRWMMHSHLPILMDYERPNRTDQTPPEALAFGYQSAISIPLLAGGELLGMYSIMYKRELPWTEADRDFLLEIGRILGVMVQRVQRSEKEVELRVLDERKRLSEEIHDNLSQLISAISIRADAVLMSFERGDGKAACSNLEQLGDVSRTVMKMLRQEMTSLRIPIGDTDGLIEGIRGCLEDFEKRWDIETRHNLDDIDLIVVPTQAALQLTRILNECLSNTLKHADASCITVKLFEEEGGLTLIVADNGRGFDVDTVAPEKLGIRIMHERAAAAGGKISIESSNSGTVVRVSIPRTS